MVRSDFISEREAESFAGVSASTLRRFSESGYLTVDEDSTQGRLYSRSQLQEIFGMNQGPAATSTDSGASEQVSRPASLSEMPPSVPYVGVGCTRALDDDNHSDVIPSSVIRAESSAGVSPAGATDPRETTPRDEASSADEKAKGDTSDVERLKNALEAQQKLLAQRESEVHDLRSQRDWLQRRIESLEEKSNRDQILLLSETQTIRKLIALQEEKKSGLRQLLSWLGLGSSQNLPAMTTGGDVVNIPTSARTSASSVEQDNNAKAA